MRISDWSSDVCSSDLLGAQWMADHHWDVIAADYVLTEGGGLHGGPATAPVVTFNVAEKGVSWRRLTVRGEPGHGSMPFRTDNALAPAAPVISRLQEFDPGPRVHDRSAERRVGNEWVRTCRIW